MQIFDLFGTIAIEGADAAGNKLQSLGFSIQNIGNNISNLGTQLYNSVTKPIVGLAESAISYNMTMEDLTTSFEVMLGSAEAAGNMVDRLKKMGAATPFETQQLAEYTKTMLSFGYTEQNVIPIMSRLGDVSLGNNEKMSSLTRTMGQINSLGKLQGGDLNQLIGQGWNPLNAITKKTGETMEQVRDRMSKGKVTYKEVEDALVSVTSKGGTFYQGMDKGSQTLSGKLSTLKDNFDSFIGDAVKPLSDFLGNTLVPWLTKLVEKFANLSQGTKTIILIFAAVVASIGPLLIVFGTLITITGTVISSFGVVLSFLGSIGIIIPIVVTAITAIVTIFTALMLSSESVRKKIKETFDSAVAKIKEAATFIKTHITDIKDAVMGFIEGIKTDNFEKFAKAMLNMFPNNAGNIGNIVIKFREFKETVINVKDGIIEFAKKVIEFVTPLSKMFAETFSKIDTKAVVEAFNKFKESINTAMPIIKTVAAIIGGILATAIAVVVGAFNGLIAALPYIIGFFTSIISTVISFFTLVVGIATLNGDMIKESFLNLWESVKSIFVNAFNAIVGFVVGLVDGIITFFKSLYDTIVGHSIIPDMVNGILNWFRNLWTTGVNIITTFINSVINWFNHLLDQAKSIISNVYNAIVSILSNLWTTGSNLVSNLINNISSILNGLWGIATNAFNGLVNAISNKIGEAGNAAGRVANGIKDAITGIASSMYNAGRNIIQSVIDGIMAMIGKVKGAAGSVAKAIKDFFPSSPAKEGALTTIPQWMPTMIGMITDDLESGVDKVKNATSKVTNAINPTSSLKLNPLNSVNQKTESKVSDIVNNIALTVYKDADINKVMKEFNKIIKGEVVMRGGTT